MRRFLLGSAVAVGNRVRLEGKEYRYLARVLRMGPGQAFDAVDPAGRECRLRILQVGEGFLDCEAEPAAQASPDVARRVAVPALPPLLLFQALPKGQKMDQIVRQACEAGVSLIVPFISARSVSRPDVSDLAGKRDRWMRIAREARQQSGSLVETDISPVLDLAGVLNVWRERAGKATRPLALLLHQDPLEKATLHGYLDATPDLVALTIGPEGGFSEEEASALVSAGFGPLLLGPNVLRTETAALYAVAAVQVVLLERTTWRIS